MNDRQMTETRQTETRQRPEGRERQPRQEAPTLTPRVDVLEYETGITLYADLPGISKEALEVKVEGDSLLIEGAIGTVTPPEMEPTYAEVRAGRYRRGFTLSRELDASRVEASLKDGVLKLRIPKLAEAQPRRVAVKVA